MYGKLAASFEGRQRHGCARRAASHRVRGTMPLKTDDLKTVENYKKAIKQDLTKIGPQGNTKF